MNLVDTGGDLRTIVRREKLTAIAFLLEPALMVNDLLWQFHASLGLHVITFIRQSTHPSDHKVTTYRNALEFDRFLGKDLRGHRRDSRNSLSKNLHP